MEPLVRLTMLAVCCVASAAVVAPTSSRAVLLFTGPCPSSTRRAVQALSFTKKDGACLRECMLELHEALQRGARNRRRREVTGSGCFLLEECEMDGVLRIRGGAESDDYYWILGVDRGCSAEEVNKASEFMY